MIPIWIVDDHAIVRQGIKQIIHSESQFFQVTCEASSHTELNDLLSKNPLPHALILDLSIPGQGGLSILQDLQVRFPKLPVLILSMHPEDQYAIRCLKAGASGYLTKECVPEQLVQALQFVIKGQKYITSHVADLLANHLMTPTESLKPHESLSDREFQILIGIASGESLTEIGESLFVSVKTISTYRTRLLKKLNLKTNAELIQYALSHELVNRK